MNNIDLSNNNGIAPEHKHLVNRISPRVNNTLDVCAFVHEDKVHNVFLNKNCANCFNVSEVKHNCNEGNVSEIVEIVFKCKRRKLYKNKNKLKLHLYEYVVVEVESGCDIGTVCSNGDNATEKLNSLYKGEPPEQNILRKATKEDIKRHLHNLADELYVLDKTREFVEHYNHDMKVTEAEWQFDHQRLTIYFTAPQRIDFRDLVKDLARTFKTRIELRQISAREEAKRIGGMGPCGRDLCCTSLAGDFNHITLDHARTQQLSNNVAKLSGYCGRLKCCLLYEFENYTEAFKKYPPLESLLELSEGTARILKVDIFKDLIYLHIPKSSTYKTITYEDLTQLISQGKIIQPTNELLEQIGQSNFDSDNIEDLLKLEDNF